MAGQGPRRSGGRKLKLKILILLLVVVVVAASWFIYDMLYGDVAQIKGAIRGCAGAVNKRDVPLFMSFISDDYRDEIRDFVSSNPSRAAIEANIKAVIGRIEPGSVKVSSFAVEVDDETDRATARFAAKAKAAASASFEAQLLGQGRPVFIEVELRKEAGTWRITTARLAKFTMR